MFVCYVELYPSTPASTLFSAPTIPYRTHDKREPRHVGFSAPNTSPHRFSSAAPACPRATNGLSSSIRRATRAFYIDREGKKVFRSAGQTVKGITLRQVGGGAVG